MHILIVHQYFLGKDDAGGSRWNQFAKFWAAKGHKITILAGMVHYATGKKPAEYKGKFIIQEQIDENIELLRCHVSESYNKSFLGRFWGYLSFAFSTVIAGAFRVKKADVVLCTSPPLTVGLTGWLLSRIKRIPMVFEVRDLWPESAIDTGVLTSRPLIKLSYWLERKSYKSSSWVNVLTPAFETALVKKKNVMDSLLSTEDNAIDGSAKELDCLIYQGCTNEKRSALHNLASNPSWTATRGNVSVEIWEWEDKAKIRIKVGCDDTSNVSIRKLASIAVDAIMVELQKEKAQ